MKLYLVQGEYGSWDNHYYWNVGYYTSIEAANEAKEKAEKIIEAYNYDCPIEMPEDFPKEDWTDYKYHYEVEYEELDEETQDAYTRWCLDYYDYKEFGGITIIPIETDIEPDTCSYKKRD